MGFEKCLSLPVMMGILLVLFNYYIILFVVVQPWMSFSSGSGSLHGILFTALNIMLFISYGLAVLRDPGQVPTNFLPDLETSPNSVHKATKERRFCDKCRQYKPARAHHCRVCKRCILRMDHHCTWTNNCVGHRNYKAFILLIFYLFATCVYSLALFGGYSLVSQQANSSQKHYLKALYALVLFIALLVSSSLLAWNICLLLQNKTTIEYYQGKRERWIADKAGLNYRHPYDLGGLANLINVLGPKMNYWLCPMSVGHIGSGLWSRTLSENLILSTESAS